MPLRRQALLLAVVLLALPHTASIANKEKLTVRVRAGATLE